MIEEGSLDRRVIQVVPATPTLEGAGVHIRRAFGQMEVPKLDPFLLLDDLRSENPVEHAAGFPWHPHRGIETVTYMLDGYVEHEDSLGNKGTIGAGDVQWMTAGSGIIHQEMPKSLQGRMGGFQLWVNLPRQDKMMMPRYRELRQDVIPLVAPSKGVTARVVSGTVAGIRGPVTDIQADPQFLDVRIQPGAEFVHALPHDHTAFAYLIQGQGVLDEQQGRIPSEHLVVFGKGPQVRIRAEREPLRFLFAAGKPLGEPVAWWGPIVMNHRHELRDAIDEFQNGTFVKHPRPAARAGR